MTAPGFPPFPPAGAPGVPGAPFGAPPQAGFAPGASPYPQAASPSQEIAFVLDIPADPTWQPIEGGDTLEKDGYYAAKIVGEKVRNDDGKLQVIMTLELLDEDVVGKKLAKFMPNPAQTKGDTWFLWRGLLRSIYGKIEAGQQAMRYTPGMFHGATVYIKSEAYADQKGTMRTGVGTWSTVDEWQEARKTNRHRWTAKVNVSQSPGVGALPSGSGGFGLPGAPGVGLPGAPMGGLPGAPAFAAPAAGVPQPGTAPMQAVPPAAAQYSPPPPAAAPPAAPAFAMPPAPAQGGFGFGPPPAAAAAPATGGFPPPPAMPPLPPPAGVPQPTANGIASGFPGT